MEIIADLQVHSKHSRATSKNLSIENLEKWGRIKGLDLIGTGDFQHPLHRKEIDENLIEDEHGILHTQTGFPFLWQTEVSLMFSQGGKRRAVHLLIFSPNTETTNKITNYLASKGRLDYDGRPIFGIPAQQLVKDLKAIEDKIEIIPAHCLLPNEKIICDQKIVPISEIKICDNVLTHTGVYKKVTNTFKRTYKGKVYKIQPYYFREGINVTEEHPFLAIKTVKNCSSVGGLCKPNSTAKNKHICKIKHYEKYKPSWVAAKDLEINDILLYPRTKNISDKKQIILSEIVDMKSFVVKNELIFPIQGRQNKGVNNRIKVTPELCRLIGYYLAEGYVTKNCVHFSLAKHETNYIQDIINLMKKIFGINLTKKRLHHGYELYFYSKVLAELFSKVFYEENKLLRAFSKKIPLWLMYQPLEHQVELLKGWWRGDAGVTISEILSQQMKLICLRLGIIPSIYRQPKEYFNNRKTKIGKRTIIASHDVISFHNLSFYEDKFNLLLEPEFKKFKTKLEKRHGWIDEKYVYIPIKNIKIDRYEGEVYNLEVKKDNSYATASAIVHNCLTPFFGLYGSKSGFDSLQECFQEQVKNIYAIESGMSANPAMLWRFKENVNIVSFSDAHSFWPWRIGRESTIFEIPELTYENIIKAIRTGVDLKATIETPPAYGRYHFDGHRNCNFSCSPEETKKLNGICPKCNSQLTIGVDYRVEEIAKEPATFIPKNAKPFHEIIPLHELISLHLGSTLNSKRTWQIYYELIEKFKNEFNILLNVSKEELMRNIKDQNLTEIILLNRQNKLKIKPGYDGVYGEVLLPEKQKTLF